MLDQYRGVVPLQKNSFIDFPGRASALLFYRDCNLRCPYCHNAPLVEFKDDAISVEEIDNYLKKRVNFLDGVAITGGEPTLHKELPSLVSYLKKELGYEVKIDTNGLLPNQLEKVEADYIAMDLKSSFEKYRSILKAPQKIKESLLRSIEIVKSMGDSGEIRITAAPGIVDENVIKEIAPLLSGVRWVFLQPFKYSDELLDSKFFIGKKHIEKSDLERYKSILEEYVSECKIRGA
jgi:pyruvate formate lyase activating enzyme